MAEHSYLFVLSVSHLGRTEVISHEHTGEVSTTLACTRSAHANLEGRPL